MTAAGLRLVAVFSFAGLGGCVAVQESPAPRAPQPAAAEVAAPAPPAAQVPAPKAPASAPAKAPASRASSPSLVLNGDFEAEPDPRRPCPPKWWCVMHADTTSFRFELDADSGSNGRYLRVTRLKPEPWAVVSQVVPAKGLVGKRVQVSVAVAAENLEGEAGPVIFLQDMGGRVIDHRQTLLKKGAGWQRAQAEITVPAGAERVEIGMLVEGGGSVGFDDVVARVLP